MLLGLDGGVPNFAADLSDLPLEEALERTGADGTADIRALFTGPARGGGGGPRVRPRPAVLAPAAALLRRLRLTRRTRDAGHLRACTNDECGALLFPRIEPAVITLVETATSRAGACSRGTAPPPSGGFSMVAGFVEIGESLEDAVRREVREEVGVALDASASSARSPGPFPPES